VGRFGSHLFLSCAVSAVMAGAVCGPAQAQPAEPVVAISVAAGPLDKALMALAAQTRLRIFFTSDQVAGRLAPKVVGRLTASQALTRLLAGSGLEVRSTGPGVLVLAPQAHPTQAAIKTALGGTERASAISDGAPSRDPASSQTSPPASPAPEGGVTEVSEVVVGSHIRGVRDSASPVIVMDRADLDRSGYTSVAEALRALPQAFGGTANEAAASTGADQTGVNTTLATGINLRGLGADATLVLVNGRRLAGTGSKGDFADVSSIPLAAVDRIEVLLDGASALYGSDAVGGVVNIVLRSHFDGAETRAMIGGAAGGYERRQFAQSLGKTWSSGHMLFAYEYQDQSALPGAKRSFAGNADLRGLGGSDWRQTYSQPGNILGLNAAGTAYEPKFAIPNGQNGIGLTPADFQAGVVNKENQKAVYDLLPRQQRHSAYLTFSQDLGDLFSLSGEARFSQRRFRSVGSAPVASLSVTRANPYFVSPTGAASALIAYSFAKELGGAMTDGKADSTAFSLGGSARLPAGWQVELYGAYAQELGETRLSNTVNSAYLSEALGAVADNPATAFSTATSGYFNPYIGQGSNPASILSFIGSGYEHRKNRGQTMSANLKLDGTLFDLPGGPVRAALGGQLRRETLQTGGVSLVSGVTPTAITARDVARDVESAFAELNIPLFGAANARPGLHRLELSLAGRYEHYEAIGSSADPKFGLIWSPLEDLTFKASYGASFRAPSLPELNDPYRIAPTFLPRNGSRVLSLILIGGNPDLRPETATSWTTGVEFAPSRWPELKINATLFETRFKNRIGQPALDSLLTVLTAPELAPFRTFVSPATNAADRAKILALLANPGAVAPTLFDPNTYGAIAEARYVNTGELKVRGLDVTASYSSHIGDDPLDLQANLSWLTGFERKVTPLSQAVDLVGTAGYPADLRARASATWTHGVAATTLSLNHVSDSRDLQGRRIGAWTTADLQVRLQSKAQPGPWRDLAVSFTVQNVLDTDPPFYNSPLGVGYDPANADPTGRLISVQLSKVW
jgi:iron complex outermembrane receptor protein